MTFSMLRIDGELPSTTKRRRLETRREDGHLINSSITRTVGPEVRWLIIEKHVFLRQPYREIAAHVQRSEHTVGNIVRKWKTEEGLEPFFKGAAGSCSLSTDELRLIEGLLKSRPDTFVTTELVQLVREVTGRGDDLRPAAVTRL